MRTDGLAREKIVEQPAHEFGPPTAGQLGQPGGCGSLAGQCGQPPDNPIADVVGAAHQVGGQAGLAANAAQGREEKLPQHRELRREVPRGAGRALIGRQGQGPLNAGGDVVDLAQQVAALHAAHGADPLHVGRLPLGQLDDQVVA